MAEFCLKCWNELNETNDKPSKYIISKDLDYCEGCGQWTNVIVAYSDNYYSNSFYSWLREKFGKK